MTPPQLRAAIASALALGGLHIASGWLDAVVALIWILGGLADYLLTRDADGDGRPDGPTIVARTLGWSERDALTALQELRRIGPSAITWLQRITAASLVAMMVGCGGNQTPDAAWKILLTACRLAETVGHE